MLSPDGSSRCRPPRLGIWSAGGALAALYWLVPPLRRHDPGRLDVCRPAHRLDRRAPGYGRRLLRRRDANRPRCRVSSAATRCTAGPTATRAATGSSAPTAAARAVTYVSSEHGLSHDSTFAQLDVHNHFGEISGAADAGGEPRHHGATGRRAAIVAAPDTIPRMRFSSGTSRWWIAAYLSVTLVCTTGWLILSQRLAEQTGLRRQVWLANDFQGTPVINDVAREPTLDFLDDDPRLPREFISARWRGYWYVPSRRSFTLHVEADDYADIWIDGEQRFARSSAAARAVRLDAGVHELQIVYQQYAGAANLAFTGGSGDAYPLPLRTGYLFPTQPEPNLLRLVGIVDRLKLTVGILWAAGALGAAIFILWRRRTTHGTLDRRWTIRLSLVLTSTAVALVTAEICLRLTAPVGFYVWPPNHRAAFNPAPGVMPGVTGVSRFIISADGIRGRRLTTSDGHRILVVGGSTSECLYLDQREAWPAIVETSLQEALGRSDIWVGNVGKSGHSTRDHRLQVARLHDQLPRIDTVILLVGINDLILRLRRDLDYRPLAEESPEYHRRLERHAFAVRRTSRLSPPSRGRSRSPMVRTHCARVTPAQGLDNGRPDRTQLG